MWMYICVYVFITIFVHIFRSIMIHLEFMRMHKVAYICVCVCLHTYTHTYLYIFSCTHTHRYKYSNTYVYVYALLFLYVYVHVVLTWKPTDPTQRFHIYLGIKVFCHNFCELIKRKTWIRKRVQQQKNKKKTHQKKDK